MWRDESGEVISRWLIQLIVFMTVVALIGYEFLSIAFTWFGLDDPAREVAVATADVVNDPDDLIRAQERAAEVAAIEEVELVSVTIDGDHVLIVVSRQADTLILHRFAEGFTAPTVDARARWRR